MTFSPLFDRIIVRRDVPKDRSDGGLYLADTSKEKLPSGEILAVGPGAIDKDGVFRAVTLRPGERVLFTKFSGTEVNLPDFSDNHKPETLIVLRESEVLGRL